MDLNRLSKKYTGGTAVEYEALREGNEKWQSEQKAIIQLLRSLPRSTEVLDIPVGTGRFLPTYQQLGLNATGMDVSRDMLEQARQKIRPGSKSISLQRSDIFAIDAPDESFDCVLSLRFMNWIGSTDLARSMSELRRVTRRDIIVGIRHFVPLKELSPLSGRLIRQVLRRVFGAGGLTAHEQRLVHDIFESLALNIGRCIMIEHGPDGTDYCIYLLHKA
jgi:ubiquinone/menaquinone biosynthesis C-methylase UbiE